MSIEMTLVLCAASALLGGGLCWVLRGRYDALPPQRKFREEAEALLKVIFSIIENALPTVTPSEPDIPGAQVLLAYRLVPGQFRSFLEELIEGKPEPEQGIWREVGEGLLTVLERDGLYAVRKQFGDPREMVSPYEVQRWVRNMLSECVRTFAERQYGAKTPSNVT